jgi:sugar phosphate isomerase/epimerase
MNQRKSLELGIVSDEIMLDFPGAAKHGVSWGITRYELRCLISGRVPAVDPAEIAAVRALTREGQLRITALSPGMFKNMLSQPDAIEREIIDVLPRTIAMARDLGSSLIIVFGFQRGADDRPGYYERACEYMRRAAAVAQASGMTIAIENEPGFWCDTGVNTRKLIVDVGSPALGANWDPCNAFGTTERPYPEGYEAIHDVIKNVHVKDTKKGSLIQCVPVGDGAIDWQGQIDALLRDRPVEHLTIETHCPPLVENSLRNVETLRKMMAHD